MTPALDDSHLLTLAGKAAFARGRVYHAEDRVRLTQVGATSIEAEVRGSELYALWLRQQDGDWRWGCSCPAADDGACCKHVVAAVLTWRDGETEAQDTEGTSRTALGAWLRKQPPERLAGWLMELAAEDRDVERRLQLYRDSDDPAALKKSLGKLLSAGGFLDHRASLRYARKLDVVLAQLREQRARDAIACRTLCEYVLGRLLRVYENSDDSAGAIGECLQRLAELHADACAAAGGGKALALALHGLQQKADWGLFPLRAYWTALGAEGQATYGRLMLAELNTLPPTPEPRERYGAGGAVLRRAEDYARATDDFDLLQRVLRWDLSYPAAHLRVIDSLREARREREALQWAEHAIKLYPADMQLRQALAQGLLAAGLDEEANEQAWTAFRSRPDHPQWELLKRTSSADWPRWRERALAELTQRERPDDATLRVDLLLHDGDTATACRLAQGQTVRLELLRELAQRLESTDPVAAGSFWLRCIRAQQARLDHPQYESLVGMLQRVARLLPEQEWRPVVTELRQVHRLKKRLMSLLTDAGL